MKTTLINTPSWFLRFIVLIDTHRTDTHRYIVHISTHEYFNNIKVLLTLHIML